MKVLEVKYLFRRNEGNYQHSEIGMTATPEEGESAQDVLAQLKKLVHEELDTTTTEVIAPEPAVMEPAQKEETEAAKPKRGRKPKVKEEEQEDAAETPKLKKQGTPYSRENDLHKKLVGEILTKEFPEWKKNPKKAKDTSMALEGSDFLDADGLVLESFKEQLRSKMNE